MFARGRENVDFIYRMETDKNRQNHRGTARASIGVKSLIPLEFHLVGESDRPKFDINFLPPRSQALPLFFGWRHERTRWCFLRAVHPISREPLAVYRLHFRSLKSSRAHAQAGAFLVHLLLVFSGRGGSGVQTGFSLLKSITAGRRDERAEWDEGGKKVAEQGNKWGITSGTEVVELISKTQAE